VKETQEQREQRINAFLKKLIEDLKNTKQEKEPEFKGCDCAGNGKCGGHSDTQDEVAPPVPRLNEEPQMNVYKCDNGIQISVNAAGYPKEAIAITVEENELKIEAMPVYEPKTGVEVLRNEINLDGFTLNLPFDTNKYSMNVEADYNFGVVNIKIPYAAKKSKNVKIN
jgi:HSP20 family molecular chaperone IbpA